MIPLLRYNLMNIILQKDMNFVIVKRICIAGHKNKGHLLCEEFSVDLESATGVSQSVNCSTLDIGCGELNVNTDKESDVNRVLAYSDRLFADHSNDLDNEMTMSKLDKVKLLKIFVIDWISVKL